MAKLYKLVDYSTIDLQLAKEVAVQNVHRIKQVRTQYQGKDFMAKKRVSLPLILGKKHLL